MSLPAAELLIRQLPERRAVVLAAAGTMLAAIFLAMREVSDPAYRIVQEAVEGTPERVRARSQAPTIVIPSGCRSSLPTPMPMASGNAPNNAAMVVIMIGRNRTRHAL